MLRVSTAIAGHGDNDDAERTDHDAGVVFLRMGSIVGEVDR
jgi:hypothetical protein